MPIGDVTCAPDPVCFQHLSVVTERVWSHNPEVFEMNASGVEDPKRQVDQFSVCNKMSNIELLRCGFLVDLYLSAQIRGASSMYLAVRCVSAIDDDRLKLFLCISSAREQFVMVQCEREGQPLQLQSLN